MGGEAQPHEAGKVEPIAVYSAPGKALLAGGYLVLFREFSAFSVGLSSRIYASAYTAKTEELVIKSPQFNSEWHYPSYTGTHKNPFLEACYEVTRNYFGFDITGKVIIWSDSGFHSQCNAKNNVYSGGLQSFSYHGCPITEVPKTGLGSSAALVVAVVSAISRLATSNKNIEMLSQSKIHNISQIAHCLAQQKVGSGFDVATAVYGSIIYSRFSKDQVPSTLVHQSLVSAVDNEWDMQLLPCRLPKNVVVIMGDVSQGSETPGMVKNVLKWKDENEEEALKLFNELNESNMNLAQALRKDHGDNQEISNSISKVRAYLQKLTRLSNVPIEPPKQTRLLDAATAIDGVLGGVVPGAGGDDAICLLVDTSVLSKADALVQLSKIQGVEWMTLDIEDIGLRSEPVSQFLY